MGFWGFGEQYVTERDGQKTLRIAPKNPKPQGLNKKILY